METNYINFTFPFFSSYNVNKAGPINGNGSADDERKKAPLADPENVPDIPNIETTDVKSHEPTNSFDLKKTVPSYSKDHNGINCSSRFFTTKNKN